MWSEVFFKATDRQLKMNSNTTDDSAGQSPSPHVILSRPKHNSGDNEQTFIIIICFLCLSECLYTFIIAFWNFCTKINFTSSTAKYSWRKLVNKKWWREIGFATSTHSWGLELTKNDRCYPPNAAYTRWLNAQEHLPLLKALSEARLTGATPLICKSLNHAWMFRGTSRQQASQM